MVLRTNTCTVKPVKPAFHSTIHTSISELKACWLKILLCICSRWQVQFVLASLGEKCPDIVYLETPSIQLPEWNLMEKVYIIMSMNCIQMSFLIYSTVSAVECVWNIHQCSVFQLLAMKIHVSQSTHDLLVDNHDFQLEERGDISVKVNMNISLTAKFVLSRMPILSVLYVIFKFPF